MKHTMKKAFAAVMSVCTLAAAAPAAISASAASYPTCPSDSSLTSRSVSFTNHRGYSSSVNASYSSSQNRYWMLNKNKKIRLITSSYSSRLNSVTYYKNQTIPKPKSNAEWNSWLWSSSNPTNYIYGTWNDYAETMQNVEAVRNYYQNTLGVTNFAFGSSSDQTIYVSIFDHAGDAKSNNSNGYGCIGFGMADSTRYCMGVDRGVVGHEFTHLYTMKKLGWNQTGVSIEKGAVTEAYSDILGELSEDTPDWYVGAQTYKGSSGNHYAPYCVRNLVNPQNTNTPNGTAGSAYYSNYNTFITTVNNGSLNNVSNAYALGSTVLSHAAYKMYYNGISKNELAKIWNNSLNLINTNYSITMPVVANAVCSAASEYFINKYNTNPNDYWTAMYKVFNAFSDVGL